MLPKELPWILKRTGHTLAQLALPAQGLPRIEVRSTPFHCPVRSGLGILSKQVDPTCGPRYWLQAAGATVLAMAGAMLWRQQPVHWILLPIWTKCSKYG